MNPCPQYAARLLPPLRAVARDLGYAVGVHGSLARDIDLIAVPWTAEAADPAALAEALRLAALAEIGIAYMAGAEVADPHHAAGCPGTKQHGRLVWRFHLGGGPYIDLSVFPPGRADTLLDYDEDRAAPEDIAHKAMALGARVVMNYQSLQALLAEIEARPAAPSRDVLVCGGRDYDDKARVWAVLDGLHAERPIRRVVQGGGSGADWHAHQWAHSRGVWSMTLGADWLHDGKAAGPKRNARMLAEGVPALVVAFPGGRGTADMVRRARAAGVDVVEVSAPKAAQPGGGEGGR